MNTVIKLNGQYIDSFPFLSGVLREGYNLSPTLCGLYVNDLMKVINNLNLGGPCGNSKIYILAYADDIAHTV